MSFVNCHFGKFARLVLAVIMLTALASCQFRPLHQDPATLEGGATSLSSVTVKDNVNTRVGQQVRNHLLFLLNGGNAPQPNYEAHLSVTWFNRQLAAIPVQIAGGGDTTSGTVTVVAKYELVDLDTGKAVARGTRQAIASYDRTGQVFANNRAERDAENRAAREVAESLRLAIASDLNR